MRYFLCLILLISSSLSADNLPRGGLIRKKRHNDLGIIFDDCQANHRETPVDTWLHHEEQAAPKRIKLTASFEEHVIMGQIPYQGWKIYISAHPEKTDLIRSAIIPLLNQ